MVYYRLLYDKKIQNILYYYCVTRIKLRKYYLFHTLGGGTLDATEMPMMPDYLCPVLVAHHVSRLAVAAKPSPPSVSGELLPSVTPLPSLCPPLALR
jgi:hypothetical protein